LAVATGGALAATALCVTCLRHNTLAAAICGLFLAVSSAGAAKLSKLNSYTWEKLATERAQAIAATARHGIPVFAVCVHRDEALILLNAMSIVTGAMLKLRHRLIEWFREIAGNCMDFFRRESLESQLYHMNIPEDLRRILLEARIRPKRRRATQAESERAMYQGAIVFILGVLLIVPVIATIATILLLPIAALCSAQLIAIISLLTRSAPWGFGEHWLLQWIVDVEVSKWPQDDIGLTSIEDRAGVLALQHCTLPNSPKFLSGIWHWVSDICLARGQVE